MLTINVVTLFPEMIAPFAATSIVGRAVEAGKAKVRVVQLRDFTHDKHHTVDDSPYGGGAGMVLKPEPFFEAVESLGLGVGPIVLMSARGRRFDCSSSCNDGVRLSESWKCRCPSTERASVCFFR